MAIVIPGSALLVVLLAAILSFLVNPSQSDSALSALPSHSNVLLLTAHPDDEAMFFAPTLLGLRNNIFSLCLSVGNADGLGETRKEELVASLDVLGVQEGKRWVVDHP